MYEYEAMLIAAPVLHSHSYFLFCTGTKFRAKYFDTRTEAEEAMYAFCDKHGIRVECTEYDKHERKYSNHEGIRFYINRV